MSVCMFACMCSALAQVCGQSPNHLTINAEGHRCRNKDPETRSTVSEKSSSCWFTFVSLRSGHARRSGTCMQAQPPSRWLHGRMSWRDWSAACCAFAMHGCGMHGCGTLRSVRQNKPLSDSQPAQTPGFSCTAAGLLQQHRSGSLRGDRVMCASWPASCLRAKRTIEVAGVSALDI